MRPYIGLGTSDLANLFAQVCLAGDRETYDLVIEEMAHRKKLNATLDAFEAIGTALLDRGAPPEGDEDPVAVVHAILGIGSPRPDEADGSTARKRLLELRRSFAADRFHGGDPRVVELATRFHALLNCMAEVLPPAPSKGV